MFWGGNHTGIYASSRPDLEFHGLAIGGSTIDSLAARQQSVLDLSPDLVSIYIGSNELGSYPDAQSFADKLFAYTDNLRNSGSKVVIATLLARQTNSPTFDSAHNRLRKDLAEIVRNAVGIRIDGVADFAADPVMGTDDAPFDKTLFSDGLHPTDATQGVGEGGQKKLSRIYKAAMDAVVATIEK